MHEITLRGIIFCTLDADEKLYDAAIDIILNNMKIAPAAKKHGIPFETLRRKHKQIAQYGDALRAKLAKDAKSQQIRETMN